MRFLLSAFMSASLIVAAIHGMEGKILTRIYNQRVPVTIASYKGCVWQRDETTNGLVRIVTLRHNGWLYDTVIKLSAPKKEYEPQQTLVKRSISDCSVSLAFWAILGIGYYYLKNNE